jgi:hypothetical protein
MLQKKSLKLILFFIFGTILLIPGFYRDQWNVVTIDYHNWQLGFDRTVIARLVQSRQDGILSAGALLGLGDVKKWKFDAETSSHQVEVYEKGEKFHSYLAYKSSPGLQGILFSIFDRITNFRPEVNITLFRGFVVALSATIMSFFAVLLAIEFGWLAAILVLLFIVFSEWMTLPAGSVYWNLWAFYLPFVAASFFLAKASHDKGYRSSKIHIIILITALIKILFNGFEAITSAFVMISVPFVYFAVRDQWGWKTFLANMVKLGVVLTLAVLVGLIILSIQIAAHDNNLSEPVTYIAETFQRRAIGNPEYYPEYAASMQVSVFAVIWNYLKIHALTIHVLQKSWQIMYWHLVVLFAVFSAFFFLKNRLSWGSKQANTGRALLIATWYSISAPLSWLIIFKPTSIIHDAIFPIIWQMPFTLLGFALCGFVLSDSLPLAERMLKKGANNVASRSA